MHGQFIDFRPAVQRSLLGELTDVGRQVRTSRIAVKVRFPIYDITIEHVQSRIRFKTTVRRQVRARTFTWFFALLYKLCRLDFLPDVVRSNSEVYLRSTYVSRTIESLEQLFHGLYPASKSAEGFAAQIRIR